MRAKHKIATGRVRRTGKAATGGAIVCVFYLVAVFADFLAPNDFREQSRREPSSPPTVLHFRDERGDFHARPFIHPRRLTDPLHRLYSEDTSRRYALTLFARGYRYKLFGLVETDRHLIGLRPEGDAVSASAGDAGAASTDNIKSAAAVASSSDAAPRLYLLGTDGLGRDRFARLLRASRFTLLVGPLGTLLASLLGVALGCAAGYAGRAVDSVLMRVADTMMALPTLVIIIAARAAFPLELPPTRAAVLLVGLFVLTGWAEMARLARGLILALRRREFVLAAESLGLGRGRVLFRHILPNAAGPLLVQATLMLPAFLLAETALSYLGVGVQEPEPSWGNMLTAASDISLLGESPFVLLSPALCIFLFVLGVRLLGDGLRVGQEKTSA
ncbi:MAG TPA: ABC transporter permease [Pyrinomonadaceae bacterium]